MTRVIVVTLTYLVTMGLFIVWLNTHEPKIGDK